MVDISAGTVLLIVVTLSQVALAVDGWVHRREKKESDQEHATLGGPSLQAQLSYQKDAALADRRFADAEMARMRDDINGLRVTLNDLGQKSSDRANTVQGSVAAISERLAKTEQSVEEVRRVLDLRNGRPRAHIERRSDDQ